MDRKRVIIITSVIVIVTNIMTALLTGFGLKAVDIISGNINTKGVSFSEVQKYNDVKKLLKSKFVDNVDDNQLMEGSIRGLADALNDPYTVYMDKKEFESLEIHTKASYAGIGVVVGIDPKDNMLLVSEIIEGSPSEKAQIHPGDKIIKVNNLDVSGDLFEKAVSEIRGEKGTQVKLTLIREGVDKPFEISVTRDEIEIKTVKTKEYPNNVGYIRIIQFAEKTGDEFRAAMAQLKSKGVKKIVIDLRDNPGGLLEQVVNVSGQLLPKGLVVYTVDKQGKRENLNSDGKGTDMPFVVLINERSASASEILAGAVKDYKRALLIGNKTFGKGVVQTVYPLGDGSGLKVTTSKYYTPKGISIHKIGVQPDENVDLPDKDKAISKLTFEEDKQLQRALEILNK